MQKLGQHYLTHRDTLQRIGSLAAKYSAEVAVEIGPGHGELTTELLQQGSRLVAIERDSHLAESLGKNPAFKDVEVVIGDALKTLPQLCESFGKKSFKIVGNIPYYITGKLLRILGELPQRPTVAVLLVQKEVAARMTAKPPRMNRLAASVGIWADAKVAFPVSREHFVPAPEVDSAVITLAARTGVEDDLSPYYRLVRCLFAQPRKTISNNLRAGLPTLAPEEIKNMLASVNLVPGARPQDLSIEQISQLAKILPL